MGWVVYYLKSTKHSAKCPFSMYCLPPNWYNFFPALNCTEQHSPTIAHKCRAQKHSDRWTDERPQESALITARLSQSVNNDISFMHQRVRTHTHTHTHTHTRAHTHTHTHTGRQHLWARIAVLACQPWIFGVALPSCAPCYYYWLYFPDQPLVFSALDCCGVRAYALITHVHTQAHAHAQTHIYKLTAHTHIHIYAYMQIHVHIHTTHGQVCLNTWW